MRLNTVTEIRGQRPETFSKLRELSKKYTKEYILENIETINWYYVSVHANFDELGVDFIKRIASELNWSTVCGSIFTTEKILRAFEKYLVWEIVSLKALSESFITDYQDKLNWEKMIFRGPLSEEFLRKFYTKIGWRKVSEIRGLSENFVREFQNELNWMLISMRQSFSEDFTWEFRDKLYIPVWIKANRTHPRVNTYSIEFLYKLEEYHEQKQKKIEEQ